MPIPHRIQKQMIQRRLVGKVGGERIKELRSILTELPDYKNGPYADLRKWVNAADRRVSRAQEGRASRHARRAS